VSSIPADRYFPDLRAFADSRPGNKGAHFPSAQQIGEARADSTGLLRIVEDGDLLVARRTAAFRSSTGECFLRRRETRSSTNHASASEQSTAAARGCQLCLRRAAGIPPVYPRCGNKESSLDDHIPVTKAFPASGALRHNRKTPYSAP